ncbi:N-acetyl-gamma-glutamyl-phosphate reductase [Orenia marismortui]|uniref:N-acetyl-gamma-glutamyl-phosphate reductase n=1 Tax=Orenia marismortui TaxID=46469 RepID=A0A4R8GQF7_9FIRM|nr:N-acetyl-gamma-glutamyl-phosphate reductase [Orenia marismortui]TDX48046.1 N-acetyl-gamma-glutamyl-phosphate reductase [Orenia marismortui]
MKVSIIGSTGYTGMELVRLLSKHPKVELKILTSRSFAGEDISDIYPNLRGKVDTKCEKLDLNKLAASSDFVYTALPHGVSMEVVPELVDRGLKVIDLSGDYRYNNLKTYEDWYKPHQSPSLLEKAVYGLPELNRSKIKASGLVANPGCYPTASILALAPLVANNLINKDNIIIDAKSGTSGAGRKLSLGNHFCEVNNNFKAYKVANHRHTSEIEEKLTLVGGEDITLSFTPHLLPINRGILATIYANLEENLDTAKILEYYEDYYKKEAFIRVMEEGILPEIKNVAGSNYCDIGLKVDERTGRIIVISAIDNLIKGSAGQAIHNLNIMAGWDESLGLEDLSLYL